MKTCRQKEHQWEHVGYNRDELKSYVWNCKKCGAGSLYVEKTKRVRILEPEENAELKANMIKK